MALGGIPYYWSFLKRGQSVAQNFDRMFFSERGELTQEFNALYASLFKRPTTHISIITALASKKMGMLRKDILDATGLSDNTTFSNALQELEQCGFIRKFMPIGGKSKNAIYKRRGGHEDSKQKSCFHKRNRNKQIHPHNDDYHLRSNSRRLCRRYSLSGYNERPISFLTFAFRGNILRNLS